MNIAGEYSFCNGKEAVERDYPILLSEVKTAIEAVDASVCKTKESKEKTMPGEMLYSPQELNRCFKQTFGDRGWQSVRVQCDYPAQYYVEGYQPKPLRKGAFREMDFVKDKLGVEVQFGKYSFMVYNVAAKMTIFRNLGLE
jgi:hypothetical protein